MTYVDFTHRSQSLKRFLPVMKRIRHVVGADAAVQMHP